MVENCTNPVTPSRLISFYVPSNVKICVEFIYCAKLYDDDEWRYLTKWVNYGWNENSWEPEESFDPWGRKTVKKFWRAVKADPARPYPLNTVFKLTPEEMDAKKMKLSPVTKWSDNPPPRSPSPGISTYPVTQTPETNVPSGAAPWEENEGDGYETGSTTEGDGEDFAKPDNTNRRKRRRQGVESQRASKKKATVAEVHAETTQPFLPVPGSFNPTKLKIFMRGNYGLQHPTDPEQTFKDFSMRSRRPNDSRDAEMSTPHLYATDPDREVTPWPDPTDPEPTFSVPRSELFVGVIDPFLLQIDHDMQQQQQIANSWNTEMDVDPDEEVESRSEADMHNAPMDIEQHEPYLARVHFGPEPMDVNMKEPSPDLDSDTGELALEDVLKIPEDSEEEVEDELVELEHSDDDGKGGAPQYFTLFSLYHTRGIPGLLF
ncbi:hypothetical protein L218DRAFT_1001552 [Marasmius fiardii PR-910]|nr:hypothetical protein L218DRAFT_1001552 [Marasmius fiardii PR-910]